jgi:hypothetical protein
VAGIDNHVPAVVQSAGEYVGIAVIIVSPPYVGVKVVYYLHSSSILIWTGFSSKGRFFIVKSAAVFFGGFRSAYAVSFTPRP